MLLPVQCSRPCWLCVTENGPSSANSSSNRSWSTWAVAALLQELGQRRLLSFRWIEWNIVKRCVTLSFIFFLFSPLLVFLKDQASSRLIEVVIQLSHKSLLSDLYKNQLKGQLVNLALHPIANFPVQRLTAASAKCKFVGSHVTTQEKNSRCPIPRMTQCSLSLSLGSSRRCSMSWSKVWRPSWLQVTWEWSCNWQKAVQKVKRNRKTWCSVYSV